MEICHGCGREIYTSEHYWQARLVDATVYFHNGCYRHYREHAPNAPLLRWAIEKNAKKPI
jgi:hypothetical protein